MTTKDYNENIKEVCEQIYTVCAELEKISKNINGLKKSIGVHYDEAWEFMKETENNEEKYTDEEYLAAVDIYDDWDALYGTLVDWHDIIDTALYHLNEIA